MDSIPPKRAPADAQPSARARRPQRARRGKGDVVECVVWRVVPKPERGEHRDLIGNFATLGFERFWDLHAPGPGRYRVEHRDDRGTIVAVRYAIVRAQGGPPEYTVGRQRQTQRKAQAPSIAWLPPPRKVPGPGGRMLRLYTLPSLPPHPPQPETFWLLGVDGWVLQQGQQLLQGYGVMLLHGVWVLVPLVGDGWHGYATRNGTHGIEFHPVPASQDGTPPARSRRQRGSRRPGDTAEK